jgi:hypothetical protein
MNKGLFKVIALYSDVLLRRNRSMNGQTPSSFVSHFDPYIYQALQSITGSQLIIQTTKGSVTGKLKTVMPDHVVMKSGGSSFFIRTQQIVWFIPKA